MSERSLTQQIESRGLSHEQWHTLRNVIWPNAQKNATVLLAYDYCIARRLDPFRKPVNIVQVWDPNVGGMADSIWPSINELRTTAFRTGQYAGKEQVIFGDPVTETLGSGNDRVEVTYPQYAQVIVHRLVAGDPRAFAGDPVFWKETFSAKKSGAPNKMWRERPFGQLAKCAEANALRIAFPEELGASYIEEEIEGKEVVGAARASGASDLNADMASRQEPAALPHEQPQTIDGLAGGDQSQAETVPAERETEEASEPEHGTEAPPPWEETPTTPDKEDLFAQIREADTTFALDLLSASVQGDEELKAAYERRYGQLLDAEEAAAENQDGATAPEPAPASVSDAPHNGSTGGFPEFDDD